MRLSSILFSLSLLSSSLVAAATVRSDGSLGMGNFTQSVQVVNLLANNTLPDVGMTPTPILVKYFNGDKQPCWMATLNYQDDYTIHAGPTQGCRAKVDRIEISPTIVAEKLKTYQLPISITLDASKYAYQITIVQDQSPVFNNSNGLVDKSGTLQAKTQAQ